MRRGGPNVNLAIYGQAFVHLVRHPSILLLPLAAAAIDLFIWYWSTLFTDPLGGFGTGLFALVVQIIYLFAFGGAVIQANNIARGYRTNFEDAWDETRRKSGGILLAAIGFQFVTWFAEYIGAFLGGGYVQLLLQIIAYFFLILTIPAAAIGGLPADSRSRVRFAPCAPTRSRASCLRSYSSRCGLSSRTTACCRSSHRTVRSFGKR